MPRRSDKPPLSKDAFRPDLLDDPAPISKRVEARYHLDLPSGQRISCETQDELKAAQRTAQPYLVDPDSIPVEEWVHIAAYIQRVMMREKLFAEANNTDLVSSWSEQKRNGIFRTLKDLDTQIRDYALKLDPLRSSRKDDGQSVADFRVAIQNEALSYMQRNLGEHQWAAYCPSRECKYHRRPFLVHQEMPHFALDLAVGADIVWNETIAELIHLYYCNKEDCDLSIHRQGYEGSLSLKDAARILQISPLGVIAAAWERSFDLGMEHVDLNNPDTLMPFID